MGKVKSYYMDDLKQKEVDMSLEDIYQAQLKDQSKLIKLIMSLDSLATAFGADTRGWIEHMKDDEYKTYCRIFGE
jgi:hypothetical protein